MIFNDHLPTIVVAVVLGIAITWLYRDLQSLKSELKRGPPAPPMPKVRGKPEGQRVRFADQAAEEEDFDEMPDDVDDP